LIGGGYANLDNIDYVTIATTGNAVDFGNLTVALRDRAACASSARGVFAGGEAGASNVIDFVEIGTLGNATDFGDLTLARSDFSGCSSNHGGLS